MNKYKRFLPLLTPFLIYLFSNLLYFKSNYIYFVFIVSFFLIVFTSFSLASFRGVFIISILPVFFTFSSLAFILLLPRFFIQLFLLTILFVLYVYFKTVYYYLFDKTYYKKGYLQNLSSYANFLTVYFLSSFMYGIQILVSVPIYDLILFFILAVFLLVYQVFWANEISFRSSAHFILLITLLLSELAWAVSFLTLNYFVLGLILAISYYVIIGLSRFYLLDILNKKLVKMYLSFGLVSVLAVILTARWI